MKKAGKQQMLQYSLMFVCVSVLMLGVIQKFQIAISEQFQTQTLGVLTEMTHNQKLLLQTRVNGQFQTLITLAQQVKNLGEVDMSDVENLFFERAVHTDFAYIGFADRDGDALDSQGNLYNIAGSEYFQKTLRGEASISGALQRDNGKIIISAVPLYQDEHVAGILYGVNYIDDLALKLTSPFFNGQNYAYFINEAGDVITGISADNNEITIENLFAELSDATFVDGTSLADLRNAVHEQASGFVTYVDHGEKHIAYYEPVGFNKNMLFSVVPESEFGIGVKNVSDEALLLVLSLGTLLVGMFGFIFIRTRKLQKTIEQQLIATQMSEAKYEIALTQSDTMIFEFVVSENSFILPDNMKTTFGLNDPSGYTAQTLIDSGIFTLESARDFLDLYEQMAKGSQYLAVTMLLRNADGIEQWYDIYMTMVVNQVGKPQRVIGKLVNVESHRQQTLKLLANAQSDPLTGLYNKTATRKLIELVLVEQFAVQAFLLIDIDDFKTVNDTFGHQVGDDVIVGVAQILRNSCRTNDIVGRIGGDEFVVFLKDVKTKADVQAKASQIADGFARYYVNGSDHKISGSIGIALAPQHGDTFSELYSAADTAMYEAKKAGKDQFSIYQG